MIRRRYLRIFAFAAALIGAVACRAEMREGFVPVPGARLFFRDSSGEGTPVILLHAASGNCDIWEKQFPAFTAAGYRVIAYDRRGWGRSSDEATEKSWTATADLLAVMKFLELDRVHLVATALGGFVAFDFAVSHPEFLRSAVIANSIGGLQDEDLLVLNQKASAARFGGVAA